ncbi:MAG: hypothetical protein H0A76_12175 [Candidatus Thiodubiliella endoseptemdiera]|uniref:Uncharacterized protein n=1 Tax=Candidatus Thiodubiliella endoseptemdiera TaxID=2738886 RepID=A0A853F7P6_9GAMM|nr:hypothetical protein [Candidatus Thiodubiliella endoseptemdiera]
MQRSLRDKKLRISVAGCWMALLSGVQGVLGLALAPFELIKNSCRTYGWD